MTKGTLHLIPNHLGGTDHEMTIPTGISDLVGSIRYFIVENPKIARRFMRSIHKTKDLNAIELFVLNKHTSPEELTTFLDPAMQGYDIGLISDAGCPGVADPGADIVRMAHRKGVVVKPHVGPSSILLGLMASGMNGQSFTFHGYVPKNRTERVKTFRDMERSVNKYGTSQIFMDTPFRNEHVLDDLIEACNDETRLCIAVDLTMETEMAQTKTIADWKKNKPKLNKRPCMFIMGS